MRNTKILLAAATLAVAMAAGIGAADAAPWDRHDMHVMHHDMYRHEWRHHVFHHRAFWGRHFYR